MVGNIYGAYLQKEENKILNSHMEIQFWSISRCDPWGWLLKGGEVY